LLLVLSSCTLRKLTACRLQCIYHDASEVGPLASSRLEDPEKPQGHRGLSPNYCSSITEQPSSLFVDGTCVMKHRRHTIEQSLPNSGSSIIGGATNSTRFTRTCRAVEINSLPTSGDFSKSRQYNPRGGMGDPAGLEVDRV
jgi:hypothetical protein